MTISWDYLAGFIDGEGYVGIIGRGPKITIGQKDKHQLEVINDFLISSGIHTNFYQRKKLVHDQKEGIYIIDVGRRTDVRIILEAVLSSLVLKEGRAQMVLQWMIDNPSKANYDSINIDAFTDLYKQGYTQGAIGERLGYGKSTIFKFSKKHNFVFSTGGRYKEGKRIPVMSKEDYRKSRAEKERTGKCEDCGLSIYQSSHWCKNCALNHRPKRGRKDLVETVCATCGKKKLKSRSQLVLYPLSFCDRECKNNFGKEHWALKYNQCIDCGTTQKKHVAHGRCTTCHSKYYNPIRRR